MTEITFAASKRSEDTAEVGIDRTNTMPENVKGAWISEQKGGLENGKVTEYRLAMKVIFVLKQSLE